MQAMQVQANTGHLLAKIKQAEAALTARYREKLKVNYDLDRTLVSFQGNKQENGNRWCKYKEGFSATLIHYLFQKVGLKSGKILDPFAGSGTSLFAAADLGIDSVGIELLPSSAEIIEVRKLLRDLEPIKVSSEIRKFATNRSWERPGKTCSFPHLRITEGAFPVEAEHAIGRYLYETRSIRHQPLRRLLLFAAMCILESVSYTRKDGQYLRWDSRSGRRMGEKQFCKGSILSFTEAITAKLEEIASDICGDRLLFPNPVIDSPGEIDLLVGSTLNILPKLDDHTFDCIVTSPPYCNRYDYTRTYALELAFLEVDEEGIRNLRQAMLSCTVENREKKNLDQHFSRDCFRMATKVFESQELLSLILEYLDECRELGSINNAGIPRMVRNYFLELALVIFECARVLKQGAAMIMVNDNVRYQGAHIPVDLILSDFAQMAGFETEHIWVLPRGKGNSSQQMGLHGREELRKCVYSWRAPKERLSRGRDHKPASG